MIKFSLYVSGAVVAIENVTGIPILWFLAGILIVSIEIAIVFSNKTTGRKLMTVSQIITRAFKVLALKRKQIEESVNKTADEPEVTEEPETPKPVEEDETPKTPEEMEIIKKGLAKLENELHNSFGKSVKEAFRDVKEKYGYEYAKELEQCLRLESANFKSTLWTKHNGPAMVVQAPSYPWAWTTLDKWAKEVGLNEYNFGTVYYAVTSDGKPHSYVKFPSKYLGIQFMAYFLFHVRGGNIAAWIGGAPLQANYRAAYRKCASTIVDSL